MLQPPVITAPPPADLWSTVGAQTIGQPGDAAADGSLIERLLARAQDAQDASAQQLNTHMEQLDSGRISTSDMLRLQADMGAFAVRVQMTVRVADEAGRAIQTLSQRS